MEPICVISDLHLSWLKKNDSAPMSALISFFSYIYSKASLLVIDGDILDREDRFMGILAQNSYLLDYIKRDKTIIIEGNHDFGLRRFDGFSGFKIVKQFRYGDALIIHGHEMNWINKKPNWAQRWVLDIRDRIEPHFDDIDNLPGMMSNYSEYLVDMAKYATKQGARDIIFGHTHRRGKFVSNGRNIVIPNHSDAVGIVSTNLINTGCWVDGNADYLIYDGNTAELKKWEYTSLETEIL